MSGFVPSVTASAIALGGALVSGNVYWTQTDWYVDPTNGSDSNPGTSALPVKTIMTGIVAKWGTVSPTLQQPTTIHLISSQPLNQEQVVLRPVLVNGATITILGTPRLVATFALNVVTAKNRATHQLLLASGFTAGGLATNQLVVNNTHSSKAWIQAINTGTATLSQPLTIWPTSPVSNFPTIANTNAIDTWAHNDNVSVYTLPTINLAVFEPRCGQTNGSTEGGACLLQNLYIPDFAGTPGYSYYGFGSPDCIYAMAECQIDPYMVCQVPGGAGAWSKFIYNCNLTSGAVLAHGSLLGGMSNGYGINAGDYSGIDLDHILLAGSSCAYLSGVIFVGTVFLGGDFLTYNRMYAKLESAVTGGTSIVWGTGAVKVYDASAIGNYSGQTWANTLLTTGTLSLNGGTTGYSFAGGTFTSRTLSAANLDTYGTIQDMATGARFNTNG